MSTPEQPVARPPVPLRVANIKLLVVLAAVATAMLVAGFTVLPGFYRMLCERTASTPNPNNPALAAAGGTGRELEVFFEARIFDRLPVRFFPKETAQVAEVGAQRDNIYIIRNLSDRRLRIHPIHQVDPAGVGERFGMLKCFCYTDMTLEPGESRELPVTYTFDPAIDARVRHVTICYSLFAIGAEEPFQQASERIKAQVRGQGDIVTPQFKDPAP